jgi:hypothetical protein
MSQPARDLIRGFRPWFPPVRAAPTSTCQPLDAGLRRFPVDRELVSGTAFRDARTRGWSEGASMALDSLSRPEPSALERTAREAGGWGSSLMLRRRSP